MKRNGNASSSSESAVMTTSSGIDRDRRVLDDRVEDVGGDFRVVVPVAGVVAQAREDELRGARTRQGPGALPGAPVPCRASRLAPPASPASPATHAPPAALRNARRSATLTFIPSIFRCSALLTGLSRLFTRPLSTPRSAYSSHQNSDPSPSIHSEIWIQYSEFQHHATCGVLSIRPDWGFAKPGRQACFMLKAPRFAPCTLISALSRRSVSFSPRSPAPPGGWVTHG